MQIEDLDTPALVVDLDIMERNLRRVADYCAQYDLRLRPHTKTHKSIFLARQQLALGAAGLTVAKVGEAEVMLGANPPDLLVAFPVVGEPKLRRLTAVAQHTQVTVALDSVTAATHLSAAAVVARVEIGVLIEIDAGLGRVGVAPPEAIDLARVIAKLPHVRLRGFTFYPGHLRQAGDEAKLRQLSDSVASVREAFRHAGLTPEIVSGGSNAAALPFA